jgi:hypothetical protein
MPSPLPTIDFRRIRQHETSQQRAWEELTFLLVPDIEVLPSGTRMERRAAPDGGLEFACAAPAGHPGGTWAWQAKYLFVFDDDAVGQMRKSFRAALASTPDLTRYTFVFPIDRSATGAANRISAMTRWKRAAERWTAEAAAASRSVQVEFVGHSQVLTALQLAKHVGAVRYFFDTDLFTPEFFSQQVAREVVNLGERYDPEVHVELDVTDHLDAVGRTPRFAAKVAAAVAEVERAAGYLRPARTGQGTGPALSAPVAAVIDAAGSALAAANAAATALLDPSTDTIAALARAVGAVAAAVQAADADAAARLAALPRPAGSSRGGTKQEPVADPGDQERDRLYELTRHLSAVARATEAAAALLTSASAGAATSGALLLTGPAGCGKSHLVADAAVARADDGHPTLLLLGQHFVPGPVWPQVSALLGVDMPPQDILAALAVAAQVHGAGRALIIIDAVNEGAGADLWPGHLGGFLADCGRQPHVGVVLTVRDIFERDVLPPSLPTGRPVRVVHPGLAGHEEEALARYAGHYGLRLPDIPPLVPEISNPLFLRSLCRSVRARGLDSIPREAASITWVFDGLLRAANNVLSSSKRLDRDPADDIVGSAAAALAEAMLDAGGEALPYRDARALCDAIHPSAGHSSSLLQALVAEGLVLRERVRPGAGPAADQIRFTYQRMSDHLRAETFLARHPEDAGLGAAVTLMMLAAGAWRHRGLLEALVLLTGERRGKELAHIVRLGPSKRRLSQPRNALRRNLADAFFDTMPWRSPQTLRKESLELLDSYLQNGFVDPRDWLGLLLSLACVPGHPLGVGRIDRSLWRLPMPERDEHWTDPVMDFYADDSSPVARTVEWAWTVQRPVPADVAEPAATLLAWFLTSPNRRLRDTATKALLHITEDHTATLAGVVERFSDVDDPYVLERVLAVAAGHLVRRRHDTFDADGLDLVAALGRAAYDAVFAGDIPEHVLIRHYARTAAETASAVLARHGADLGRDLAVAAPPYKSPWPMRPPSLRELAARHGRKTSRYLFAVSTIGPDFERKVIEGHLCREFVLPDQARRQAAARAQARRRAGRARERLIAAFPPRRQAAAALRIDAALAADGDWRRHRRLWLAVTSSAPPTAVPLIAELQAAAAATRTSDRAWVRPDAALVGRWIAGRVLDLGWTVERFGRTDDMLSRARSHGWTETERFGKKYGWIAFHQAAGILADHCQVHPFWSDDAPRPYAGPWDADAEDIDPTVILRGDQPPDDSPAGRLRSRRIASARRGAWWLAPFDRQLDDSATDPAWLHSTADMPALPTLVTVTDPAVDEWALVDGAVTWRIADPRPNRWDNDRRVLALILESYLYSDADAAAVLAWAAAARWPDQRAPGQAVHGVQLLKGYPDLDPWPAVAVQADRERGAVSGWMPYDAAGTPVRLAAAASGCTNDVSRDMSARDHPRFDLPSPVLVGLLDAVWARPSAQTAALGLGDVETETAWSAGGAVVAFATAGTEYGSPAGLYVRRDALDAALARTGLRMLVTAYAEKIYWAAGDPSHDRAELHAAVELAPAATTEVASRHVALTWEDHERRETPLA